MWRLVQVWQVGRRRNKWVGGSYYMPLGGQTAGGKERQNIHPYISGTALSRYWVCSGTMRGATVTGYQGRRIVSFVPWHGQGKALTRLTPTTDSLLINITRGPY